MNHRMFFAIARGAKIEYQYSGGVWLKEHAVPLSDEGKGLINRRIAPEHQYLQYGPISSALRYFAEHGKWENTMSALGAQNMMYSECPYLPALACEWPHFQMFALFLSEHLADLGA